jgi:Cytoskeletal-regulatory complex EF hand
LGLFNVADEERRGQIAGATAVKFFSRSKLPVDVLKTIWVAADNPPTNFLDHRKFAIAVRLIQLTQNGLKGQGANLTVPGGAEIKPAFFDGVSGNLVQLPQQQPPSQHQQASPPSPSMQPTQQQTLPPTTPGTQTQQQAPLSPTQQQMQMNAASTKTQPPTPPRPPQQQHGGPPGAYGALTVQDPYTLTPNDQARYETLFAEQCKDDGFLYGGEAVAFFSKSGLPSNMLASIWNMTDYPVDNRLDKIEFCVAMHLIICVSKRNLPLPPALPFSLKQLKSQTQPPSNQPAQTMNPPHQQQPAGLSLQQGQSIPPPPLVTQQQPVMNMSSHSVNVPNLGNGMGPPNMAANINDGSNNQYGSSWSQPPPSMAGAPAVRNLSGLSGPPPLQSTTASISDAFEGLVTGGGDAETVSTYRANTPPVVATASFDTNTSSVQPPQHIVNRVAPSLSPELAPMSAPPIVQSSYSSPVRSRENNSSSKRTSETGTNRDTEELRLALQKLQAENISLKARLSTINGEEEDVRSELVETVSQIAKLSGELTTLRAEVLAAKSRLLEVTGELTAAKEKKR